MYVHLVGILLIFSVTTKLFRFNGTVQRGFRTPICFYSNLPGLPAQWVKIFFFILVKILRGFSNQSPRLFFRREKETDNDSTRLYNTAGTCSLFLFETILHSWIGHSAGQCGHVRQET